MQFGSDVLETDNELWNSLKQGNEGAFDRIYQRYVRLLYKEISKRINDQSAVADLTQDLFLSLWEKRDTIQPQGEIYPYLYGMAINRVLNYYRKNKHLPHFVTIWDNLPEEIADTDELSIAFRQAHNEELESLLDIAITELPPRMKQVYTLRYVRNKTVSEIADMLATSPHTVYNQLKVIRKRFVAALKNTSYFLFF
ncbi:RNA polymerase sigma factor [Parapedobacter deserti]|uniref:RNA polymerase sigma factor n=1 Tax=Parapedobacter deserti TaxID=1912957 RepID=A0ABV7JHR4_9SPHI